MWPLFWGTGDVAGLRGLWEKSAFCVDDKRMGAILRPSARRVWNSQASFWWLGEVGQVWTGWSWEVERTDVLMISCGSEINHPGNYPPMDFLLYIGRHGVEVMDLLCHLFHKHLFNHFHPWVQCPCSAAGFLGHDLSWHPLPMHHPLNSTLPASRESWKILSLLILSMLSILPGFLIVI